MNYLLSNIKQNYGYSDYEIAQMRYTLITISSEASKLVVMGTFFALTGTFYEFVFATIVLMCLRTNMGGIHFNHYTSCLLFSLAFMYLSIVVLPIIPINILLQLVLLIFCMIATVIVGPVPSIYRIPPNKEKIRKVKLIALLFILCFITLLLINPKSYFINICFWTIICQTIQLIVSKLMKGVTSNEKSNQNLDT